MRTASWKLRRSGVLAVLALACSHCVVRGDAPVTSPRLVVLIVVDQLRYDLLDRYRAHFVAGGFERFLEGGARYTEARYLHSTTETGPGHAVISTGTWPRDNGIVANRWMEHGSTEYCDSATLAERRRKLLGRNIADVVSAGHDGKSRVVAASSKACAAQLLGAAGQGDAYWQGSEGQFATWRDEGARVPAWVERFNAGAAAYTSPFRAWNRLLPEPAYSIVGPDDRAGELGADGRRTFPHAIADDNFNRGAPSQAAWLASPFPDEVLADFAIAAIDGERLGDDDVTDLLALSFSASDRVAHRYGPDSHEHMDTIVRLDRQLARLLDAIDARVGLDRSLLVLTADHGVAPMPEVTNLRVGGPRGVRVSEYAVNGVVEMAMTARYGVPAQGRWIAFNDFPNLYLDPAVLARKHVDMADAARLARDAAAERGGVSRAYSRADLVQLGRTGPRSAAEQAVLLSFRADRSGDVVYELGERDVAALTGSGHGSHWSHDSRVPMIWLGPGVRPGPYAQAASPADIAPTLFKLLGLDDPGTQGRVLDEMLATLPGAEPVRQARPSRPRAGS